MPESTPAPAAATAAPAASPAAIPNPVLPPGLIAQSPLERFMDQQDALAQQPGGMPPELPPSTLDAQRLEQARAADRGEASRQPQQQQQSQPGESEALLRPRRPNGRTVERERNWQQLNAARDNALEEVKQLRAEVERLRGGGTPDPAQIDITRLPEDVLFKHPRLEALKKERDQYYEEIKHVRVEADPEFKAKFDTKRDAALRIARSVAGGAGDDIARILSINDPDIRATQLAERIKDFSEGARARILAANAQLAAIEVEREIEISTRKATWEQTQKAREAQQAASFDAKVQHLNREFDTVFAEWSHPERGMPFLVDDRVKNAVLPDARRIFSGEANPRSLAEAALKAALFPEIIKGWQAALQEIDRLRNTADRFASAYPGVGDYNGDTGAANTAPAPVSPGIAYDPWFANGLEAARRRDMGR